MLTNLMYLKLLKKEQFKKTAESTGDLIGSKIANKIARVPKTSSHNSSETVTNDTENTEHHKEIPEQK